MKYIKFKNCFNLTVSVLIFIGTSQVAAENLTLPSKSMNQESVVACKLQLLYPKLIHEVSCTGTASQEQGAGLPIIFYKYGLEHNNFYRSINGRIHNMNLNAYIEKSADGILLKSDEDDSLIRSPNGVPQLASLDGDCGQEKTRKLEVTPIAGHNWTGLMWEQSFSESKKKLKESCKKFTPAYRCVALILGNDKMSASFPTYCFLRKKNNYIDPELSFDVFMDMIKTFRFSEGIVIKD